MPTEPCAYCGRPAFVPNVNVTPICKECKELEYSLPRGFAHGGLVKRGGLALLHRGEVVLPGKAKVRF